jgi:predicted metal-dependent phosphoesterase TrpH
VTHAALQQYFADLHVHTALSPCGADEMTPPAIVAAALQAGLALVAVCDHNSARNAAAVQDAAGERLTVLAGMEVTSAEEAHVLGLFPTVADAEAAGAHVSSLLPDADDDYTLFWGEQPLMDAGGQVVGSETRALGLATTLTVDGVVELIHHYGGLAIAAHIDRRSFGVISQLGFFPAEAGLDAVELSSHVAADSPRVREFSAIGLPMTAASDAHYLADIGCIRTLLVATEPTFDELARALRGQDDRSVARA